MVSLNAYFVYMRPPDHFSVVQLDLVKSQFVDSSPSETDKTDPTLHAFYSSFPFHIHAPPHWIVMR